jgi:ankyrin repeat protein
VLLAGTEDPDRRTILHAAAYLDAVEVLRLFHRDVHLRPKDYDLLSRFGSPLHCAVAGHALRVFEFLAEFNLNASAAGNPFPLDFNRRLNGVTLLQLLVRGNHWEMIPIGNAAGMDLRATDRQGQTALHACAMMGSVAGIKVLCACGADPNAADPVLWTPLHCAASQGDAGACRELLYRGAFPHVISRHGMSPILLACRSARYEGRLEAAVLIRRAIQCEVVHCVMIRTLLHRPSRVSRAPRTSMEG